jgi:hypothetical protein
LSFIAAIASVGVYVLAFGRAATPDTGAITSGWVGMCLDDLNNGKGNAHEVDLYTCNKSVSQLWQINSNKTISLANGYCLGVNTPNGKITKVHPLVQIFSCKTTTIALTASYQQWRAAGTSLINVHSGMCLTVPGSTKPAKSTATYLADCSNGTNGCIPRAGIACPQYIIDRITTGQIWHLPTLTGSGSVITHTVTTG